MKTVNIAKSIKLSLDENSLERIFKLTNSERLTQLNPNHAVLSRNKYIKNLKAYVVINSLPEATSPNINLEDSETEKLNKLLDVEWNSERKQVDLLFGTDGNWMNIGESSLLNPAGYPYRIYNLLDLLTDNLAFELGNEYELAVKITDAGFGLLSSADKVNIYGSYIEELVIDDSIQPISSVFEKTVIVLEENLTVVLPNSLRKYVLIQNNNSHPIHFSLSGGAGSGSTVINSGGHYEFSTKNVPYFGEISIYSEYNSNVLITEAS